MGDAGLCGRCGGRGRLWRDGGWWWCRCSGRTGAAPDRVLLDDVDIIPVADWLAGVGRRARRR